MVVTAGATQGQSQEDLGCGADDIVQLIESVGFRIGGFIVPGSQAEIPGGDHGLGRGVLQLVSGQLLQHKAVKGLVPVEGPDHVVPVFPDVGLGAIPLVTVAFGVADQVQPVPGPALSVGRTRQQVVDGRLIGSLAGVLQKGFLLCQVGWQSSQVEVEPPEQLMGFGLRRGLPVLGLQFFQNEGIDRIPDPVLRLHGRRLRAGDRPESPVITGAGRGF